MQQIQNPRYSHTSVTSFINGVNKRDIKRYTDYWNSIKPKTHEDYYYRWLFSFMSIHTTWRQNVIGYLALRNLPTQFTKRQLHATLVKSRAGLINMRLKAIWDFHLRFWANPREWYPKRGESMPACRDRLAKTTFGIGLTKTSFVLEMAFPTLCNVVCLDTHILQLYNYNAKGSPSNSTYKAMESHWIDTCNTCNVASPMVRHIYWDKVQQFNDTRYWSYVFE